MSARAGLSASVSAAMASSGASGNKSTGATAVGAQPTPGAAGSPAAALPGGVGAGAGVDAGGGAASNGNARAAPAETAAMPFALTLAALDTPIEDARTDAPAGGTRAARPAPRAPSRGDPSSTDPSAGALEALALLLGAMPRIAEATAVSSGGNAADSTVGGADAVNSDAPGVDATQALSVAGPLMSAGPTATGFARGTAGAADATPVSSPMTDGKLAAGAPGAGMADGSDATRAPKTSDAVVAARGSGASQPRAESARDPVSLPPLPGNPTIAVSSGTPAAVRQVLLPVSDRAWPQAVAAQVHWLVAGGTQTATLKLSPEHLGPLEVRIELKASEVNVTFSALHPETRGALEQAVPRLRELLAGSGLTLGNTQIEQEARSGSSPPDHHSSAPSAQNDELISVPIVSRLGLIDEYA